jgi:hypothetical protein
MATPSEKLAQSLEVLGKLRLPSAFRQTCQKPRRVPDRQQHGADVCRIARQESSRSGDERGFRTEQSKSLPDFNVAVRARRGTRLSGVSAPHIWMNALARNGVCHPNNLYPSKQETEPSPRNFWSVLQRRGTA